MELSIQSTHKKMKFSLKKISSVHMTFTEEILNEKLHVCALNAC